MCVLEKRKERESACVRQKESPVSDLGVLRSLRSSPFHISHPTLTAGCARCGRNCNQCCHAKQIHAQARGHDEPDVFPRWSRTTHTHTRTHVSQTVDGDRGCEPQAWVSDWPRWSHQYPGHPYQAVAVGSMPFGAGLSTHKKVRVKESAGTECRRFEAIFYFKTKANVTSPPSNLNFNFRFLFQRNIARDQKMPTK